MSSPVSRDSDVVDDAAYATDVAEDEQLDNMSEPPVHHNIPLDQGDAGPAGVKNS